MKILLAEDDTTLSKSLKRLLEFSNYNVETASNGEIAWEKIQQSHEPFSLFILDWNMPKIDGLQLCKKLRQTGDETPIIILTARDEIDDKSEALDSGADDYVVKPFATKELLSRIGALLRRTENKVVLLKYGLLSMNLAKHQVFYDSTEIKLGRVEWALLYEFLKQPEEVLSHSFLYTQVWNYDFDGLSNTLEVHIGYLRKQLASENCPKLIKTVRSFGYVLKEET